MSNELVKMAPADRPLIKSFQFILIPSRIRSGCIRCVLLAACLLRHVPPSSCLPLPNSLRSTVSLTHLAPRPVVRVVPRFSVRLSISSYRLAMSCLLIGHVRLVSSALPTCSRLARSPRRSAYPPRLSCRRAGRPSSRSHLVMRSAYRHVCSAYRLAFRPSSGCDY